MITNYSILRSLQDLHWKADIIMAQSEDLAAALDTLTTSVAAGNKEIADEAASIAALHSAGDTAGVAAAIDRIKALSASIDTAVAAAKPADGGATGATGDTGGAPAPGATGA